MGSRTMAMLGCRLLSVWFFVRSVSAAAYLFEILTTTPAAQGLGGRLFVGASVSIAVQLLAAAFLWYAWPWFHAPGSGEPQSEGANHRGMRLGMHLVGLFILAEGALALPLAWTRITMFKDFPLNDVLTQNAPYIAQMVIGIALFAFADPFAYRLAVRDAVRDQERREETTD